jgi:hypothetical protein
MQAAGHLVKEKDPKAKIIYMPLMDFVRNITTSLRHNTIEDIKSFYQSANFQKYSHLEGALCVAFLPVVDPQHRLKYSGFYRAVQ